MTDCNENMPSIFETAPGLRPRIRVEQPGGSFNRYISKLKLNLCPLNDAGGSKDELRVDDSRLGGRVGEESMPDKHKSRHTSASEVWLATRMCRRAKRLIDGEVFR